MKTTLRAIKAHRPCTSGWKNLLSHLGKTKVDDEPLSIITILDNNGLDDALWCLRAVSGRDREIRLYMVWCARRMPISSHNPRIVAALDVAERFVNGGATEPDLATVWDMAWASVCDAIWDMAWAAAWAAGAVRAAQEKRLRKLCKECEELV